MREYGLAGSATLHALVLAVMLFGLPSVGKLEAPPEESLPVEIMTSEEFTALTRGEKSAPPKPAAEVRIDRVAAPNAVEADKTETVKRDAATPPPRPQIARVPEPQPEPATPPPPAPKPAETKADAPPPEPAVPEIDEAALKKAAETLQEKVAEKPPEPVRPTPTPPKRPPPPEPAAKTTSFDAARIAALIDKDKPARKEVTGEAESRTASLGSSTGAASKLTVSQRNALVGAVLNHVKPCWSPPAYAADATSLAVLVQVDVTESGLLAGEPQVIEFPASPAGAAAARAALRALKRCVTEQSPLVLPPELYGSWRLLEINFDPRDLG